MSVLNDYFKLASDETRFRILLLLKQKDLCVCQLCGIMDYSQPKVSKHLTKLRDTKFVVTEQRGKYVYYKLNVTDERILHFMEDILENSGEYPVIMEDSNKIADAEVYIKTCRVTNLSQE